jgi:hypothetical protein
LNSQADDSAYAKQRKYAKQRMFEDQHGTDASA